tara:strand:+ start:1877 stop:2263 length:387 start_codon:yes stop_codon:yes gene_type:complete
MAKMTLLADIPRGILVLEGVEGEGPFTLFKDVETEVHAKRALACLGDSAFKVVFTESELNALDDESLAFGATLLGLDDASGVKKALLPKKKTTAQKVKETVKVVTSSVTPTTTNDQSTDEASLANDSA